MAVESTGPHAALGDICVLETDDEAGCFAEVVGFRDSRLILMPLGELTSVYPGTRIHNLGQNLTVACGDELLGRVLNGLGRPIDGLPLSDDLSARAVNANPPNPMQRQKVDTILRTGVRAIDSLLTVGRGQRMGIFAGSGVGKSTLLSMIAKNSAADVNVIALIGERGREVREFVEDALGVQGMAKSVVIAATSDESPLLRTKAAFVATSIAEYFRDRGHHVNLMMDSVTRFAMAQREIGLAAGEPPTSKGYTPSVFALLPRLLERSGPGMSGTITAFYTVLVDGDDFNEPISDAVRGILDGHVILSRSLSQRGQFPAIDMLASLSRLFPVLVGRPHLEAARRIRSWLQRYKETEDLLRIGAYKRGVDPETDLAIDMMPRVEAFLAQEAVEPAPMNDVIAQLLELGRG